MKEMAKHIDKHYERELTLLKEMLIKMANLVEEATANSIKALNERNQDLAEQIIKEDEVINNLEIEIEEQCLQLLALRQPIAVDLRFITSVMKINNDLERMGDIAVNIAERVFNMVKSPFYEPSVDIPYMAELSQGMLRDSFKAFINQDSKLAREVCKRDDEVDNLNRDIFRNLLKQMIENSQIVGSAINLISVGKYLERIADHATNIAEDIVYMLEGVTIKHRMSLD